MGSMDDNWRTMYNESTRAPIYSVNHYIAYLRRFVADTAAAAAPSKPASTSSSSSKGKDKKDKNSKESPAGRPAAAPDGIDPLSYFLRKLKLDLKVSYDSFVRDFVRPQNGGFALLHRLLANLQSAMNKSSSTLGTTPRLDDYKKSVTDEHDCLLCIKFCLRVQSAVGLLVQDADSIQRIVSGVQGSNSKARITCLEILTLCLLDPKGVDAIVEAFTVLRLQTGQSIRFKMLVSMLHTKSPTQVLFQVSCLKLFNTLLNACASANQRVYLQHELLCAGLDISFLMQCAEGDGLEYDDLRREINEWKTRFIDVDALLKRLRGGQRDRDTLGGLFSEHDGPLQVSSRRGSVRSSHGHTFFQPEELAGTVHLGAQFRRDFVRSSPHLAGGHPPHLHNIGSYDNGWHGHPPLPYTGTLGYYNIHGRQLANGFGGPGDENNNHNHNHHNDSEIESVSSQPTPILGRKYPLPLQSPPYHQPRSSSAAMTTSSSSTTTTTTTTTTTATDVAARSYGGDARQSTKHHHAPGVPPAPPLPPASVTRRSARDVSVTPSASDPPAALLYGHPPRSSFRSSFRPHDGPALPGPYFTEENRKDSATRRPGDGATLERRGSLESIVDAYGLVIHGRDRQLPQQQQQQQQPSQQHQQQQQQKQQGDRRVVGGGSPADDFDDVQLVYSNWRLNYYNSDQTDNRKPNGGGGGNDAADNHNDASNSNKGKGAGAADGHGGGKEDYDGSRGLYEDRPGFPTTQAQPVIWNSYYPFSQRALYRGHENAGLAADPPRGGDATLSGGRRRQSNAPPSLKLDESGTAKGGGQGGKEDLLRLPDPDYSPVASRRGSTRSLNTEVAKVLLDFENTLRAHEHPLPGQLPAASETINPVAFV